MGAATARRSDPGGKLLLRLVFADALRLLDAAGEQLALARDDVELNVGELAPLLHGRALELLTVAFDAVSIHLVFLALCGSR
jgi:hypothetical protein